MAKTKAANNISPETRDEAMKIALSTQRPGQTKEQTKLVAQGIQKGIALYKNQQKVKARDSDKKHKKAVRQKNATKMSASESKSIQINNKQPILPWLLLLLSWMFFGGFIVFLG